MDAGGGEEVHLDLDLAVAVAGLAASALGVEGEAPSIEASGAGGGELGEELANVVEDADVGGGAGAGGLADGRLIHFIDGGDVLSTGELPPRLRRAGGGRLAGFAWLRQSLLHCGEDGRAHERAFAAAADSGEEGEASERDADVDVLQVVGARTVEPQPAVFRALLRQGTALAPQRMLHDFAQGFAGDAGSVLLDFRDRAHGRDFAAEAACAGAEVDDGIRAPHGFFIVLDDEERVALVAQGEEGVQQCFVVARMQADGRFIKHIQDAAQIRAELGGKPDALGLATAERVGAAIKLQVAEADLAHEAQALLDLRQDVARDLALRAGELQFRHALATALGGEGDDLLQAQAFDLHGARDGIDAAAVARGAGRVRVLFAVELPLLLHLRFE